LIPLKTSHKVASPEGGFVLRWLAFFFTGDFTGGGGLFLLYGAGGGGGDCLEGDGDGDAAMPWNTSSSSRAL
jgi:hypothetical protein